MDYDGKIYKFLEKLAVVGSSQVVYYIWSEELGEGHKSIAAVVLFLFGSN